LALVFGTGTLLVSQTLSDGDATYHGRHSCHAPLLSVPKNAQILPAFTVQCNEHSVSKGSSENGLMECAQNIGAGH
jgi:hypothetical protein